MDGPQRELTVLSAPVGGHGVSWSGNRRALALFALPHKTKAKILNLKVTPARIKIGESVQIHFTLRTTARERLRLEYWVHFIKAKGHATKKVFQIFEWQVEALNSLKFTK